MQSIKFFNLKDLNSRYNESFHEALDEVLASGWLITGKKLESFEKVVVLQLTATLLYNKSEL